MEQRIIAYLNMSEATFTVLDKYTTEWNTNAPAQRKVTDLKADYAAIRAAAQGGSTVTTGITAGKEEAGDAAIKLAVKLTKLTQAYALEKGNTELYQQMRVSPSQLDDMADQRLALKLKDLHQLMVAAGQPLEEYGITTARLQTLAAAIETFDKLKTAPRVATGSRSASNASILELLRHMRVAFTILDNLIKGADGTNPTFVREYLSARNIINTGGRSGDTPEPPTDSK